MPGVRKNLPVKRVAPAVNSDGIASTIGSESADATSRSLAPPSSLPAVKESSSVSVCASMPPLDA